MRNKSYPHINNYLEIKLLKRRNLCLLIPIFLIFILWMLSTFSIPISSTSNSYKIVRLLVLVFVPGCYFAFTLGKIIRLSVDEILFIDFVLSISLVTIISIFLSYFFVQITFSIVSIGLLFTTMLSGLLCLPRLLIEDEIREKIDNLNISKAMICLLVSFSIGFIFIVRVIPPNYWRGWDPWLNTPVIQVILEKGLNPYELVSSDLGNLGVSGFYYFLAFVKSFTGIDSYTITRYGGPVITGIVCVITYLIVKRLEGLSAGLLASFFLSLNSFFITRFSMTLRENFSYIFLLSALLFLVIERDKQKSEKVSGFYYILSIGWPHSG